MSVSVVLKDDAVNDLAEAITWYESRRQGLGDDLLECVGEVLHSISEKPQRIRCCTRISDVPWYNDFHTLFSTWNNQTELL